MVYPIIVKDKFGQHYVLKTPADAITRNGFRAESFWNPDLTLSFVQGLCTPHGYWQKILQQFNALPSTHTQGKNLIQQQISKLLIKGIIRLYPIKQGKTETPLEKLAFKNKDNITYLFAQSSILLTTTPKEVKIFSSRQDAKELLTELAPDKEKLKILATELGITLPKKTSAKTADITTAIIDALFVGTGIVIVDRFSRAPAGEEQLLEEDGPGDRKADLGPPPDEYKEINIELDDEFDKNMPVLFSLFNGLEYTIETDLGEVHKGTIEGGKIQIARAKMNRSFEIKIKDMPAYMDM